MALHRMQAPRRLLLALMLTAASAGTAASTGPSVLIANATLPRIKALALDTALARSWTLIESRRERIVFETPLDQPASAGPPGVTPPETTHLRIRLDLEQLSNGIRVSIQAEERWWRGSAREWRADVTHRYRDNLQEALRSLRQRWQRLLATSPTFPQASVNIESSFGDTPVGLWAYYAERYARAAGCDLDDRGAVLVHANQGEELHRVFCRARAAIMVRCNNQGCRRAR
ncbi:MAG: hypothetical protein ACLFQI_07230 [Halochromatium sp.]|uniref:hypothetical protein n=1 Tax=Halochromatium sp. TaxID=2049430 RepID=UPI00397E543D